MIDWAIAKGILEEWGVYSGSVAIIFWLLLYLIKYQEKRRIIAEEKNREDWNRIHEAHREDREKHRNDRDEWISEIRTVQDICFKQVIKMNDSSTEALRQNTAALSELTVHIEMCNK